MTWWRLVGRRNGKASAAHKALLVRVLMESFVRSRSKVEDADRTAMTEVTGPDGRLSVRVLTLGEIADRIVEAGWTPPTTKR